MQYFHYYLLHSAQFFRNAMVLESIEDLANFQWGNGAFEPQIAKEKVIPQIFKGRPRKPVILLNGQISLRAKLEIFIHCNLHQT